MRHILSRTPLRAVIGAAMASLVMVLAGCGSNGIQSIPLPGGVDTGDNPRTYQIQFDDILDLVPQSMVKMNGIPVGRVEAVEVPDNQWYAQVKVEVQNEIDLSDKATAAVQQTSLLGEKFIELSEPEDATELPRQNPADPIPLGRTRTATDIEQVLGALSMLLNGGGINQLQPIVTELNKALEGSVDQPCEVGPKGRTCPVFRSLLEQTQGLITGLNRQRDDIVNAIDGLARLSTRAANQKVQIERILDEIPEGVAVLEEQRPQLVDLLTKLDDLGEVGTDVLTKSRDSLITDLKALRPVLTELSKAAPDLITAAPLMLTHPFPDWLLPGVHGDSTNLFMTLDLRLLNQLEALGVGQGTPEYSPPARVDVPVNPRNPYVGDNGPRYGWPTITLLPPGPNWRPGPNTPPSGGTYPMNPASGSTRAPSSDDESSTEAGSGSDDNADFTLLPPAQPGQRFIDGPLDMIGAGR
ncbi:MCE family protein [Gordonia sp. Z-3]|jgi:phospholipid/cholesterol/gamma-HCH transport system substrate-binding protein|uniref:MCE family protein n=3 Tax=Gordoniaceae TaxID=85026 RepID=A0A9X3I7C2_9ACTN|nr:MULTISPECIES: MCE family protein [Gordonia]MCF3938732.1 MCE family protein [Gordonia tangerina]MCX2967181.1 MCE family protein [Gordonia aquimaris]MED5802374.1 MCE family protein [Gordonia sp. Z-3]